MSNGLEMVIHQLFSLNNSFKVSCKLIIQGSSFGDKNFPTIDKFSSGNNNFLRLTPNPYIEININNSFDRKNGQLKIKKMNFTRRDICVMIEKLKKLVSVLYSDNNLFYKDNGELKVDHTKAEQVKLEHANQNNMVIMRPIVFPYNNDNWEGVIYAYGGTYENYTFLSSAQVRLLLYEFERIDLNSLGIQLLNTYFTNKTMESRVLTDSNKIVNNEEEKPQEMIDIKPDIPKSIIPEI